MAERSSFGVGEWYHCYNRGVDKRIVFEDAEDYNRFLLLLYLGNSSEPIHIANLKNRNIRAVIENASIERGEPLVEIGAYTLIPNHFHFILESLVEGGMTRFMHRLEMGYSQYFNRFYGRSGNLFQGTYKAVLIDDDAYFNYLPIYIHLNPLDLLPTEANWKEKGVKNKKEALKFLARYQWSSLSTYLDIHDYPFVVRDFFGLVYKKPDDWEKEIIDWLPEEEIVVEAVVSKCASLSGAHLEDGFFGF